MYDYTTKLILKSVSVENFLSIFSFDFLNTWFFTMLKYLKQILLCSLCINIRRNLCPYFSNQFLSLKWLKKLEFHFSCLATFPVAVEPVNDILATRSFPRSASVTWSTWSREQGIVLMTPAGKPASSASCQENMTFHWLRVAKGLQVIYECVKNKCDKWKANLNTYKISKMYEKTISIRRSCKYRNCKNFVNWY